MPGDQTIKDYFCSHNNLLNATFQSIQSKWVVATPIRTVLLLQQSIPFGIAVLYIMVQKVKFSLALKAKTSSLHIILF